MVHNQKEQLLSVVLKSVSEWSHFVERLDYCQESILVVNRVVELDIELHWDHIAIGLLDKHRHLVINDKRLPSLIITVHEFRMFLPYKLRHESFNTISKNFFFTPPKKHAKTIVDLNYLAKFCPISINDDEISQV
jgi:hypothetical protein